MTDDPKVNEFMGRVDARLQDISRRLDEVSKSVDDANQERFCLKEGIGSNARELAVIKEKIGRMEPAVGELTSLKAKGMGVFAAVSIIGAVIGATVWPAIKNKFGL